MVKVKANEANLEFPETSDIGEHTALPHSLQAGALQIFFLTHSF